MKLLSVSKKHLRKRRSGQKKMKPVIAYSKNAQLGNVGGVDSDRLRADLGVLDLLKEYFVNFSLKEKRKPHLT